MQRPALQFRGAGRVFPTRREWRPGVVDFHAAQPHFLDHLAPIYLECKRRGIAGRFIAGPELTARATRRGIDGMDLDSPDTADAACMITASIGDTRAVAGTGRHLALLEHGCGLSFSGTTAGHSGGGGVRAEIDLFLMTNEYCASRDRAAYPEKRVIACGSPKMDAVFSREWPRRDPPIIGYATHWDAHTAPETQSAFPYYRQALQALVGQYRVIAHTHPRSEQGVWNQFSALGLDTVRDWSHFIEQVDLLVCDVGSAPYEFAATGRPVVVCNCPLYRKTINHGLRFWENVPGLQVDDPRHLLDSVKRALADPPEAQQMRRDAVAAVYPHKGEATKCAVDALEEWVHGR
jgi:hypothetical protein